MAAGEHLQQQGGEGGIEQGPAEKEGTQKRLLFDTIAKYYSGQERAPLLSERYLEVHAGILGLLGENQGGDGQGGNGRGHRMVAEYRSASCCQQLLTASCIRFANTSPP